MISDIILNIKQWICIHDYRPTYYGDQKCYRQCVKCGKIK